MKIKVLFSLIMFTLLITTNYGQSWPDAARDRSLYIPELKNMRSLMVNIGSTLVKAKDDKKLIALLPDVAKAYTDLAKAKFPALWKNKQDKWNAGMQTFTASFEEYKKAAGINNPQKLFDAAANLKTSYDALEKLLDIHPRLGVFKKELFILYTDKFPKFVTNKSKTFIAQVNDTFKNFESIFGKGEVSREFPGKLKAYSPAYNELRTAIRDLMKETERGNNDEIKAALELVTTKYNDLEAVLY